MKLMAVWLFAVFLMASVATLRADQLTEEEGEDFMAILMRKKKESDPRDKVRIFFKIFDKDGDGFVTSRELYEVLKKHDEKITLEEVENVIRRFDTSRDGKLDPYEMLDIALQ